MYTGVAMTDPKDVGRRFKQETRRLCIFVREHIGDVVNSTGAIHSIRRNCPRAIIGVSVGANVASTLDNSPDFDFVIRRPKGRDISSKASYLLELRRQRFDSGIILDEAGSQARNAKWSGIKLLAGIASSRAKHRFQASVPFNPTQHETRDQCTNLLRYIGFDDVTDTPHLYPNQRDVDLANKVLESFSRPTVIIHPGASERTRRWLPERFGAVAAALIESGCEVLLTGSEAERTLCEAVAQASGKDVPILAGSMGILAFGVLAAKVQAVIVGDTGPMHVAAAMGAYVIVPYGSTYPHITGPFGELHTIVQGPCSCTRRDWKTCTYECMQNLEPAQIIDATQRFLLAKH